MSVVANTVIRYLSDHRRIVVPQLGALIVKEADRSVVLSELLKRDDGVLRLLLAAEGMTPLEAAGSIDRFVFEVRHAAEHGERYRVEGLGVFSAGPNGTIRFDYLPEPQSALGASDMATKPAENGDAASVSSVDRQPSVAAEAVSCAVAAKSTRSTPLSPDPSVKGLRYGKPIRTTNAYTYVGAAKRRRPDKFLLLALLAVLIAVGAILYGYLRERRMQQEERLYLEHTLPEAVAAAPDGGTPAPASPSVPQPEQSH